MRRATSITLLSPPKIKLPVLRAWFLARSASMFALLDDDEQVIELR